MIDEIDRKFTISAVCRAHGHTHSHKDAILFLAQDAALPAALKAYKAECVRIGVHDRQLKGIDLMMDRVQQYQGENPNSVKLPDVDVGGEEARVNRPNGVEMP